jgi:dolichol-phosphate mannosyltransferase
MIRFFKFGVVGATGVVVDMGVLAILVYLAVMPLILAKTLATELAIMNNFILNDRWTFRDAAASCQSGRLVQRFMRSNVIAFAGLCLNVALFHVQVFGLGLNLYLANLVSIGAVAVINYMLSKHFGWRMPGAEASPKRRMKVPARREGSSDERSQGSSERIADV